MNRSQRARDSVWAGAGATLEPPGSPVGEQPAATARVLAALERRAAEVGQAMADSACERVPAIARVKSLDDAFPARLHRLCAEHVLAFVSSARLRRPPDETELGFVRELGARRAQDLFPLESLMRGLRAGQRVLWSAIVAEAGPDAEGHATAVALTDCLIDYTDTVSCELERSYAERRQALAHTGELAQREFFEETLSGRLFAREDAAGRAATAGFVPDAHYVVAAVAWRTEPADRAGLEDLRAAFQRRAWADGRPPFVVARGEHVIVVIASRRISQVTDMIRSTAPTIEEGSANQVVAGVGGPCRGLSEVPRGCEWALLALRHARGVGGVVVLDDVSVFDYLLSSADPTARRLSGRRTDALRVQDEREGGTLTQTFAAYIDCDLNVVRTAKALGLHANTVRHRLAKVGRLTGLDTRRVPDVIELAASVGLTPPRMGAGG